MSENNLSEIEPKEKINNELSEFESEPKDDVVKYETFKRVLSQHKKSQETIESLQKKINELSEFKSKADELNEEKMKSEGNWKALLEQREARLNEYKEELAKTKEENQYFKKNIDDMVKINALTSVLGGTLRKNEYYSFVDTDKIAINPDTGAIDQESLKSYANEFQSKFKELIDYKPSKLPNGAPSSSGQLTYEDWLKLPLKEQLKRQSDVKL